MKYTKEFEKLLQKYGDKCINYAIVRKAGTADQMVRTREALAWARQEALDYVTELIIEKARCWEEHATD